MPVSISITCGAALRRDKPNRFDTAPLDPSDSALQLRWFGPTSAKTILWFGERGVGPERRVLAKFVMPPPSQASLLPAALPLPLGQLVVASVPDELVAAVATPVSRLVDR